MTYNLKIINSGDRIEIYKISNYFIRTGTKDNEGRTRDTCSKQTHKDKVRNLRESRNKIVRLIKSNPDMTTFITLTFKEVPSVSDSKQLLTKFFRKLKKDYEGLKYLYVLELGELNGRLHYHVLCNMDVDIKLSPKKKSMQHKQYEQEFSNRYWQHGFVDIRSLEQEDNSNIALYVSTYIVKSLENTELEAVNIFNYSRNLNKPEITKIWSKQSLAEVLSEFKDYKVTYTNSYKIGENGQVNYVDMIKEDNNEI